MELQLSTAKAEASLKRIEAGLDSLRASLDRAGSGSTQFNTLMRQLETMRGVNPAAVSSITQLNAALRSLGGGQINQVSASLNKLAGLDVNKAAVSVRNLTAALNSIRVPAGLAQIATQMNQIATSATRAAAAMRAFSASASNFRPPAGLAQTVQQLNQVTQSANSASKATAYFGTVAGNLRAGLAAVGIAALGRELGQFVKGSYEAQVAYDKFNAIMNNTSGPGTAAAQFDFLRKTAAETATDLRSMMDTYPKFSMAATAAGFAVGDTAKMFQQAAIMTRGFGLSTVDAELAMRAITQMMTKGRIQAEELRQQLAERGVPAMAALAQGTGKATAELEKMMEQGKLTTEYIQIMLTELANMSAASVAEQLRSINAQMTALANSFTLAQLAFGAGFFPIVAQGLAQLNALLSSNTGITFFNTLGMVAGVAANLIITAVSLIGEVVMGLTVPFRMVYEAVSVLFAAFAASPFGQLIADVYSLTPALFSLRDILFGVGVAVGVAAAGFIAYRGYLLAAATASAALTLATRPWVAVIIAGATAVATVTGSLGKLSRAFTDVMSSANEAINKFVQVEGSAYDAANGLTSTKAAADNAANGLSNVNSQASQAPSYLNATSSSAYATADAFGELATRATSAASAVNSLASANNALAASGGGGGGNWGGGGGGGGGRGPTGWGTGEHIWDGWGPGWGQGEHIWDAWRAGGIVGGHSLSSPVRASLGAFADAPRFAAGGTTQGLAKVLPDGGIPSILHPNEAVVPLAQGSIPVELKGTSPAEATASSQSSLNARDFHTLVMPTLISINKHAGSIDARMITLTDRVHDGAAGQISRIDKTNDLLSKLLATGGNLANKSTLPSATTPVDLSTPTVTEPEPAAAKKFNPFSASTGLDNNYTSEDFRVPGRGGFGGTFLPTAEKATNDAGSGGLQILSGRVNGYAKGSPNVFEEAMGRSARVTVHPNEAVVPLPDGRRIPVDISGLGSLGVGGSDTFQGAETTSTGSGNITVNITVHAKDADSFRASQEQILQQMQQRMRRAVQNLGETTYTDDPTVRPKS